MVAKKIILQTREKPFNSIKEAKDVYKNLPNELFKSKELISSGQLFKELNEIYTLYCKTEDQYFEMLKNKSILGFKGDHTIDKNTENHFTTTCLYVVFSDETTIRFSLSKALSAIAS